MRSLVILALLALSLVTGCNGGGDNRPPAGEPCSPDRACPASMDAVCVELAPNRQGAAGICSAECFDVGDCGEGEGCVPTSKGNPCLRVLDGCRLLSPLRVPHLPLGRRHPLLHRGRVLGRSTAHCPAVRA